MSETVGTATIAPNYAFPMDGNRVCAMAWRARQGAVMNVTTPASIRWRRIRLPDCVLNCAVVGTGEPALLLHGWPQTSYAWRAVIPLLADRYTLVVPDLPGFGASSRLASGYDKKSIAGILHRLMLRLGFQRYHVAGHDVGGQVAYPLAGQYPDAVRTLTLIEAGVIGLGRSVAAANPLTGGSWHFGFNMVPDLPELLLAGRERAYLEFMFHRDSVGLYVTDAIGEDDLDVYARALARPGAVRATMGYYRTLPADMEDNRTLSAAGPITMPTAVVGARYGVGLSWIDTVQEVAAHVSGHLIDECGHYVPEEQPGQLADLLATAWRAVKDDRATTNPPEELR